MPEPQLHRSRLVRLIYIIVGIAALATGIIGIVVPVLPTTPFILLAAACFMRSSETLHRRLLANRIAGPIIRDWEQYRSVPPGVKRWAYLMIAVSFGVSIGVVGALWLKALLAALACVLVLWLWHIPVREAPPPGP